MFFHAENTFDFFHSIQAFKDVLQLSKIIWLSSFHTLSARLEEWDAAWQQSEKAAKSAMVLAAETVQFHAMIKCFIMSSVLKVGFVSNKARF